MEFLAQIDEHTTTPTLAVSSGGGCTEVRLGKGVGRYGPHFGTVGRADNKGARRNGTDRHLEGCAKESFFFFFLFFSWKVRAVADWWV